jgi:TATA-box binding protein (TBP) (component of TFIID and TFIIIB)
MPTWVADVPININNVVCTCQLVTENNIQIDLERAARELYGRYDKNVFPAATFRSANPNITIELFSSGKMVAAGARSANEADEGMHIFAFSLSRVLGIACYVGGFDVQNVVGNIELGHNLDVARFFNAHKSKSQWNESFFSGLQYRIAYGLKPGSKKLTEQERKIASFGNMVVTLFKSGKVLFAGGKTVDQVTELYHAIKYKLAEYRAE